MGKIWIAGIGFEIDAKVVRWDEGPGFDGHAPRCINPSHPCGGGGVHPFSPYMGIPRVRRIATRPALRSLKDNPTLRAAQSVLRHFVLHHDGCPSAATCFNVLHNERGLSCHFLIDNDGTIFQTIDLALAAWHAAQWNFGSIGVELCNYGDARARPDYYSSGKHGQNRNEKVCKINGHKILAFDYTEAQYDSFAKLVRALQRLLPNIPLEYPQSSPGVQSWETLPEQASFGFSGYITHYHLTNQKWDPGPFEFGPFLRRLRGAFCLPIFTKDPKKEDDKPLVPEQAEDLKAATDELYKA